MLLTTYECMNGYYSSTVSFLEQECASLSIVSCERYPNIVFFNVSDGLVVFLLYTVHIFGHVVSDIYITQVLMTGKSSVVKTVLFYHNTVVR